MKFSNNFAHPSILFPSMRLSKNLKIIAPPVEATTRSKDGFWSVTPWNFLPLSLIFTCCLQICYFSVIWKLACLSHSKRLLPAIVKFHSYLVLAKFLKEYLSKSFSFLCWSLPPNNLVFCRQDLVVVQMLWPMLVLTSWGISTPIPVTSAVCRLTLKKLLIKFVIL